VCYVASLIGLVARLLPARARFASRPVYAGFVEEKVVLGQIFSEHQDFSLLVSFHTCSLFILNSPTLHATKAVWCLAEHPLFLTTCEQRRNNSTTNRGRHNQRTTNFPAADLLSVKHSGFNTKISSLFLELERLFQLSSQQDDTRPYTQPGEYTPYSKTKYLQHIATIRLTSHLRLGLPNLSSF
jgi:hypothetical protein